MRRVWIALTVVTVASALALPAAAVKPVKPDSTPKLYEVTMGFVGNAPGLSTECPDGVSILMFGAAGPGTLDLWDTDTPLEAPLIHVRAPDVDWKRMYPEPDADRGFDGCHGPSVYNEDIDDHPFTDHGGTLMITIDYDAETVDFLWHFDYYIDGDVVVKKNPRFTRTISEHYTMSATASYDTATRLVQGSFPVSWYLKEGRDLLHGYDLFEPIEGTDMMFDLVITSIEG